MARINLFIRCILLVAFLVINVSCGSHKLTLADAPKVFDLSASLPKGALSKVYDINANSQLLGEGSKAIVWSLSSGELVCTMWITEYNLAQEISPSDILLEMGYKKGDSIAVGDKSVAFLDRKLMGFTDGYYETLVVRYSSVFIVITYSCLIPQTDFELQSLATVVVEQLNHWKC
ncbi:MAG: hypothetical protein FWC25_01840 [Dehalococcoidia bacterium]|jgi:hypothetical protein|nr:hypothetical protein [Dehalococcoidia bacterium]